MTAVPVDDVPPPRLRVTAHAIPETEPPYDDDGGPPMAGADRPLLPYRKPAPPPTSAALPPLRLVRPVESPDAVTFDAVRTARGSLEDPVPRAAMLTRALVETIVGVRPLGQLTAWVAPDVLATIQSMVASRAARPAALALRRVLVSEPVPGVAEVTAVVQRGERAEALALRLEGRDGRWVVTALQRA